jgi:hypothetical protein
MNNSPIMGLTGLPVMLAAAFDHSARPDSYSQPAKSSRIRKLIFRNYSLDVLRLALDAVSNASICLDGQVLNDGINHWWVNDGATLRTLGLVANVLIQLIGM